MVNILFKWINVMLFAQIPKYRDFWNGFRKCCDFWGNLGAMASL